MQELSSKTINKLNSRKIFCIPSENQRWMAYFVVRAWGNYLFFPHPDVSRMYPFIKGQGGIYKIFDQTIPFPYYNGEVFTLFGASTVGLSQKYHEDFQMEVFGEEYFDVDLSIYQGRFKLFHQKEEFSFFDINHQKSNFDQNEFSRLSVISCSNA